MSEKERCSICGAWMTNFDTSFEWEGNLIPHNLHMCTNPRCPDHIEKDFLPHVIHSSAPIKDSEKDVP